MPDSTFNNKLTTRQHRLADLIDKEFEKNPDAYLSFEYLYQTMREDFSLSEKDNYTWLRPKSTWNNQKARRDLTNDVLALKKDDIRQGIIITSSNGCKRATKQEAKEVLESERISLLNSLKRNWFQTKKMGFDNQTRIVFNEEKDTYEVFRKGGFE